MEELDLKSKFKIETTYYAQCTECFTAFLSKQFEYKFYTKYLEIDSYSASLIQSIDFCYNCRKHVKTNYKQVITDFPQILILMFYPHENVKCQLSVKFNETLKKSSYSLFSCVCSKPESKSCKFLNFVLIGSFLFLTFEFR
jgi:hypothetical protein